MSLDVYLIGEEIEHTCICSECGNAHAAKSSSYVYDSNITHNLGRMADAAGIYDHLWRPEELGITKAADLIHPLEVGLIRLKNNPEHFQKFNASNGWGMYEQFVQWVEEYLQACKEYPEASVRVSR